MGEMFELLIERLTFYYVVLMSQAIAQILMRTQIKQIEFYAVCCVKVG